MKVRSLLALGLALACAQLWAASGPQAQRFKPEPLTPERILAVPRDGTQLLLLAGAFDPTLQQPDFAQVGLPDSVDGAYGIVQFKPDQLTAKEALEQAGVEFVGYLPDNAFQVRLNDHTNALLAGHAAVRWSGPYRAGYKVHPRLWPASSDSTRELTLRLFRGASLEAVERALAARVPEATRLQISDTGAGHLRYGLPLERRARFVAEAAQISGVALIEPYDRPELHNNDALAPIQSNVATALSGTNCTNCSIFNHNLTGAGQIAAVADSGNDSDMCFFRYDATPGAITNAQSPLPPGIGTLEPAKKLIAYFVQPGATAYDNNAVCTSSPTSFHGTHTSSTVVGDNFATLSTPTAPGINLGDGMAPNAKLVFQDVGHDTTGCLSGLNDPYNMYLQASLAGARVHSNSYGAPTGGAYTADDATADRYLFDHEEMAIFFSAGNNGPGATTIGSPGNSKDVVTVGALGHGNVVTIASFSSRGPTADGRRKPDIMAPGSSTISAAGDASHSSNNCGTKGLSGTSMSCPTTAGGGALLREYFEDGYYPTGAASAADALSANAPLVKAALLNGTLPLPLAGPIPNTNYGWGRLFLDNNLFFSGDGRELRVWNVPNTDGLQTGQSRTFNVTVGAGQEFRATLVWSDPEASPGAAPALVNNLNLTVNDGTNTYLGNVFTGLESTTGGTADLLNNVEQVLRLTPLATTYTITVASPSVPGNGRPYTNRQGFALVVAYAGCATAVATAPSGLSAIDHVPMGVDLSWTSAAGSNVTQVYRAVGNCSTPAKAFQYIGSAAGTAFIDSRAEGGVTYAYKLRGADGCGEGPASGCVSITPTGICDLLPTFGGLQSAASGFPDGQHCRIRLGWNAGSSNCPAGPTVRYNVYRSTTPNFTPAPGNLLASPIGATIYDDNDPSVANNTTYYYTVRAEDNTASGAGPHGGNEEPNNKQFFGTAQGAPGAPGTFSDGAGDGHAYGSPESPWKVTTAQAHTGSFSYHPGPDTGTYPPNVCAALTTPSLSLAASAVLSYWVRYNIEDQWDGTIVEISTNGGASWSDLPPTTPAGYPSSLSQTQGNGCGYPASQGAFNGPTGNGALTAWTQYQTNLGAFAGQNVLIRWRFTTDGGAEFEGFYLDDVTVTNVNLPTTCVPTPVELQRLSVE